MEYGKKRKAPKVEKVTKPYMKGDAVDRTTLPGALKFFAGTVVMTVAYLIICMMLSWYQQCLNITVNLLIVLMVYMMFLQFGMNTGADAVNQGEIMLSREQKGRPVASWERQMCFHPLKGLISALIGSIPLLLISILLACIAKRQMTGLGTLPGWLSGYESRPEIGSALAIYHEAGGLSLESILRLIVRMSIMPYVNMVGAANKDGMLLLERLSPLVNLLPAIAYGLGYMGGVSIRTTVHTNIALGKKKAQRKQAKERRVRRQAKTPEQLN